MSLRKFGLIGKQLSHSFSAEYFLQKFNNEGIHNAIYKAYELQETELKDFLYSTECIGLNVTIPYKESIIPFLDEMDEVAEKISSVNTIKVYRNGLKKGFNTDHLGFSKSLNNWNLPNLSKAMILGNGGASKAIRFVLKNLGISITQVSRVTKQGCLTYEELKESHIQEHQLIINCTPLGMYPNIDSSPFIPYHAIGNEHFIYDLVYNPTSTQFMEKARLQGAQIKNGLEMLQIQAEESWKIWNDSTI